MSNIQKWGTFEVEDAQEEKEELAAMGGGAFLKLAAGKNVWRFLPPPLGKRTPFVKAYQHYIEVPGQPSGVSFNCPQCMEKGRKCRACVEVNALKNTGNRSDYEAAMQMAAKVRVYTNVISRANPEAGPQIAAFGKMIYEQLLALREDPTTGGDFTDPMEGFDIVITKTGEKKSTKYDVKPARLPSPLGELEWIEMQQDLTRFTLVPTDEEIQNKLSEAAFGASSAGAARRGPSAAATAPFGRGQAARPGPARAAGGPPRGRRTAEDDATGTDE